MPSWYSVVKVETNYISGECATVGLIVFDDDRIVAVPIDDAMRTRAETFFGHDLQFAIDAVNDWNSPRETPETLRKFIEKQYIGSVVQISEPRGSLRDIEGLVVEMRRRLLRPLIGGAAE